MTLIIAMLGMFGPFSVDAAFPAFDHIGRQFGSSAGQLQQITSVYLLAFGVASLFHGPISDAVGRKPVMTVGIAVYSLACVGAALSPSLGVLLACRVFQGLSAGSGQILSRALIRDMFSGIAAQRLMAQVSMIFAVAPALAPVIGGWLLGVGSWPVIFWFMGGFGVLMFLLVVFRLPETHPASRRTAFRVTTLVRNLVQVGREPAFVRLALAGAMAFSAQFLYITSTPILIVHLLHKGDQDFWMFFLPMITAMMIGSWLNGRLAATVAPVKVATAGFVWALVASALNISVALLSTTPVMPWAVVLPALVAGGVALCFPVLQLAMLDLFPTVRGAAASVQSFVALMVEAAIAAGVTTWASRSLAWLALTSAGFSLVGLLLWSWHLATRGRVADR